ncbi:hypothetical protein ABPG72_001064 [Tetrahymena utriculariae]
MAVVSSCCEVQDQVLFNECNPISKFLFQIKLVFLIYLLNLQLDYIESILYILLQGLQAEVKSLWSLYVGLHTCYKGKNKKTQKINFQQIFKNYLSSDCFMKFQSMKMKSLVIVNYNVTVKQQSNFAHTAHHARKVNNSGRFEKLCVKLIILVVIILFFNDMVEKQYPIQYWQFE